MAIQDVIFVCVSAPLAHLVELAYASRPLDASSARRHGSALSLTRLVVSPLPYCTSLRPPLVPHADWDWLLRVRAMRACLADCHGSGALGSR